MTRPWDTPGLPARTEDRRCVHHRGQCAYRDDDPNRCPTCHRTWAKIATDDPRLGGGTPADHNRWHQPANLTRNVTTHTRGAA